MTRTWAAASTSAINSKFLLMYDEWLRVTRTFRVPLGTSSLTGKQGLDQAARF